MKKVSLIIQLLCVILFLQNESLLAKKNINYHWQQSAVGGGGYITGILQDPVNAEILYGRCDVAGVFKSTDRGKSWAPINNGTTEYFHHSVDGFAISPSCPNVLFRCSGDLRGNRSFGTIHKSKDGGTSWYPVCNETDFFGNGPNRMMGEKISVNPNDPLNVAAISYHNGIFVSTDEGEHFSYSGLKGEPGCVLVFHPYKKDVVYAGTRFDLPFKEYLYPTGNYTRPKQGKLFVSNNKGRSWELCYQSNEIEFLDIAFDATNPDIVYVASSNGIYKSTDGGKSFLKKTVGLAKAMYTCITADVKNAGTLYTAARRTGGNKDIPLFPVYRSVDFGESWQLINENPKQTDFINYPSFVKNFEWVGWAISKIKIDVSDSNRLYTSNWWGVSVSNDGGKTWNGNLHKGTETQCIDNIVSDPLNPNHVYFSLCDHNVFRSEDNGKNYLALAKPKANVHLNTSTVVCPSRHKSDYLLYGITERNAAPMGLVKGAAIVRSVDGGITSEVVKYFPEGHFVQAIKEDYQYKGRFYAYIDGSTTAEAGVYCSNDWGERWTKLNSPFPVNFYTLPYRRNWVESELLPVVYYQVKNSCGTNQLLCVDPFRNNTFYLGESTEGVFCTTDCGQTWRNISANLPFKKDTASALVDIKTDEKRQGVIYAGFVREGLWRTTNFGKTWKKIYPLDNQIFNATSTVVGGITKNELYLASEPLYWSNCPSAILYSADNGNTWQNVMDTTLGAIRWKCISVNKQTGTIHAVASGNGCFYAERKSYSHLK